MPRPVEPVGVETLRKRIESVLAGRAFAAGAPVYYPPDRLLDLLELGRAMGLVTDEECALAHLLKEEG